jgi:hypothetical protein
VTKIIYLILINLVTPKAQAKHEPLVQQTGHSLLDKSSCLAQALGVTIFGCGINVILVTICCAAKERLGCSTNPPLNPEVGLLNIQVGLK